MKIKNVILGTILGVGIVFSGGTSLASLNQTQIEDLIHAYPKLRSRDNVFLSINEKDMPITKRLNDLGIKMFAADVKNQKSLIHCRNITFEKVRSMINNNATSRSLANNINLLCPERIISFRTLEVLSAFKL